MLIKTILRYSKLFKKEKEKNKIRLKQNLTLSTQYLKQFELLPKVNKTQGDSFSFFCYVLIFCKKNCNRSNSTFPRYSNKQKKFQSIKIKFEEIIKKQAHLNLQEEKMFKTERLMCEKVWGIIEQQMSVELSFLLQNFLIKSQITARQTFLARI